MILTIDVNLHYQMLEPTDLLLQIEAADLPDQRVLSTNIELSPSAHFSRVAAENDVGERIWLRPEGDFISTYRAKIDVQRQGADLATLPAVPLHLLPADAVRYLLPSRYCPTDEFEAFVTSEFDDTAGGARIMAIADWISRKMHYAPGSSTGQTTAVDSFVQLRGVCRDFAHVLITLARASAIPARFVSAYSPDVSPQDFHALTEVYLEGGWHLVDPTAMAKPESTVRIGVGADAADVAFMTSFAPMQCVAQSVRVSV
jgi:transglutaminase-like putative cysteine protease